MKKIIVVGLLFFGLPSLSHARENQNMSIPKLVRVRLMTLNFPLKVEGSGVDVRGIKKPSDVVPVALPTNSSLEISFHKSPQGPFWIVKKSQHVERVRLRYLEIQGANGDVRISGYTVPTPALITPRGDVIAAIPFDDYLLGVMVGEMPTGWPMEALKAQAVAARSYTLFQVRQREKFPAELDGSVLDQAFVRGENEIQRSKIKEALKETANLVLKDRGRILKAYYHSDCGGQTEDPALVWNGEKAAGAQSVVDRECAYSAHSKWKYDLSLSELLEKLKQAGKPLESLNEIKILTRTPSGRAALLALNDETKRVLVSGNELRQIVGYSKLKSTLFDVTQDDEVIHFSGKGFGHGSGLCQWGAKFMASRGSQASDILHHYYPAAQISSIH